MVFSLIIFNLLTELLIYNEISSNAFLRILLSNLFILVFSILTTFLYEKLKKK